MRAELLVSIVIPVKNGTRYLAEVLEAVGRQETDFAFEIVAIDSGSTDGSLEILKKHGVRLIEIDSHEFNHGSTRNLAISKTRGKFVVLLTHDATPADSSWLKNLVAPLLKDEGRIAGVFGRHVARPKEDPIVELGLVRHFERFRRAGRQVWEKDANYEANRGDYIFFSNNNSCLRKSVWEKIPFKHTDMAEDQQWAESVIEAGYAKAYAHDAVVIHSHSYSAKEWMRRTFDEYRSYYKLGLVGRYGWKQSCKSALWLWRNDLRDLFRMSASRSFKMVWAWRRLWISLSIALGQFFGTHFERLPEGCLSFFSMQLRNIRARQ